MRALSIALIALLALSAAQAGEVYRWVDDEGTVHFSDEPRSDGGESRKVEVPEVNTAESVEVEQLASTSGGEAGKPAVVMYSASWCGVCDKARAYLERNDIPFQEYDVEKSRKGKRIFAKMDVRGVPVIIVGDQRMVGFSAERFERMYDA